MASHQEYAQQPIEKVLDRLQRTAEDLADAIRDQSDVVLSRRPGAGSWSAKEVICHLRDIEELCMLRYHAMLSMDEPRLFVVGVTATDPERWGIIGGVPYPVDADRWAQERQYLRNDTATALGAFRRRRDEVLTLLQTLTAEQWQRRGLAPMLGRVPLSRFVFGSAAHDDTHLDQLRRALDGRA